MCGPQKCEALLIRDYQTIKDHPLFRHSMWDESENTQNGAISEIISHQAE